MNLDHSPLLSHSGVEDVPEALDQILSRRMGQQFPLNKNHDLDQDYLARFRGNLYSPITNSQGVINLGTAFSYLCEDLMAEQVNRFTEDAVNLDKGESKSWHPSSSQEDLAFRRNLAKFFSSKYAARPAIDPENLVLINGTTSALDCLAHCIADAGDVFLIPTPAYTYLYRNVNIRAQVEFHPVDLVQIDGDLCTFTLTAKKVEDAISQVSQTGKRVSGLILVNPNNPLGQVYSEQLVTEILRVCFRHKMHTILDEIHSLTVFDPKQPPFLSAASYDSIPDPERTHVLWSFSKDFCAPGFKMAIIHSKSEPVLKSLKELSCIFSGPNLERRLCSQIISDTDYLENTFIPTHLQRLRSCHEYAEQRLTSMGVKVHPASSGFVLMADFSTFLGKKNFDGERDLLDSFIQAGVYMTPGHIMYCSAPGWFRVVVSKPKPVLQLAMDRIEQVLCTNK